MIDTDLLFQNSNNHVTIILFLINKTNQKSSNYIQKYLTIPIFYNLNNNLNISGIMSYYYYYIHREKTIQF